MPPVRAPGVRIFMVIDSRSTFDISGIFFLFYPGISASTFFTKNRSTPLLNHIALAQVPER
jgi:hypothetical protein